MTATATATLANNGLHIVVTYGKHIESLVVADADQLAAYNEDPQGFVSGYVARHCAEIDANEAALAADPPTSVSVKVSDKDIAVAAPEG